jgi:hypothetical protein
MDSTTPNHPPGLSGFDTRVYPLSLLYPVIRDMEETRDVYVFFENDGGEVTLERHPYHRLDEIYRKQIKAVRRKRSTAFFSALVLDGVALLFSVRYFKIFLFLSLLATLYEFMDRRIRYLWLRREYDRTRRSQTRTPVLPGPR